jgi:hypothetical protein
MIQNKTLNAIIRLRKDHERQFQAKNTMLMDGEVAIVLTDFNGYRVKIGDGEHSFNELPYENLGVFTTGYYDGTSFFYDLQHSEQINPRNHLIFLDLTTAFTYYWDKEQSKYILCRSEIPMATSEIAGVMRLHQNILGQDANGAVSQKAIYETAHKIQTAANTIEYTMDTDDEEMLVPKFSPLQTLNLFGS